jgi:hypothetical protein
MAYKYNPISGQLDLVTDLTFTSITAGLGYTPVNVAGDTMLGNLILNADPTNPLGAVTKQYVDNNLIGLNFHSPVRVATVAPLPAVLYADGPDPLNPGVSATLTATANGALIIDGEDFSLLPVPSTPYRVLIKDQVSGLENGIYTVTVAGDSLTPFQLTRATDADNSPTGELAYGDFCFVETGTANGGLGYILNTVGPITVGVTPISYVTFNAAQVVTAGYGLQELTPNVLSIDTSIVLDNATAALTYLTITNASLTYVPYTGAVANVDLGLYEITANKVNISNFGDISTSGADLIFQAASTKNLIFNTPNITAGAYTKIQFGGADLIELKGLASTATVTNFRYTNPNNTGQQGPVSSMIIDPGTRTWDYTNVPNGPADIQKEIEILSPNYTDNNPGPAVSWDGLPITFYINAPTTNTQGVGVALGIKGHFIMNGDAIDYPGGTYMSIGNGDGTMIGGVGAKLSFFGNPPVVRQGPVTDAQGIADALTNLGFLFTSTISGGGTSASASAALFNYYNFI